MKTLFKKGNAVGFNWKPQTYYHIHVKFTASNSLHHAILYSGFLIDGVPGSYSFIIASGYEQVMVLVKERPYQVEVIKELKVPTGSVLRSEAIGDM